MVDAAGPDFIHAGSPPSRNVHRSINVMQAESCSLSLIALKRYLPVVHCRTIISGALSDGKLRSRLLSRIFKANNFERLKAGLVDRLSINTNTVEGFLRQHPGTISRYILLDHMDWMAGAQPQLLQSEWQAILDKAAPESRILWRSAGMQVDFVDPIQVQHDGKNREVGELLQYQNQLATELHEQDRVNTYGSFYIADLLV